MKSFFQSRKRLLAERKQRIGQRLIQIQAVRLAVETKKGYSEHAVSLMAAGVAYYWMLTIIPLTIAILAILDLFLPSDTVQQILLDFFEAFFPGSIDWLEENIEDLLQLSAAAGVVALIGFIWAGSAFFGAINRAINRAWGISKDRPYHMRKLRDLGMVLGVVVLMLMSTLSSTLLSILNQSDTSLPHGALGVVFRLFGFLVVFAVFLIIYRYVPNARVLWRYVWPGALAATVAFEIAQTLFAIYLTNWANYESIYGLFASFIIILLWFYISALIVIIGAELSAQYNRMRYKLDIDETA